MTQTDTEWSQQRLAAQMLRFAYARLLLSIVLSIAVTLLFINVLFPYFRHDLLWRVVWVIVAANLCRLGLWFCYRQAKPADENTASWATWFFISSTAAAAFITCARSPAHGHLRAVADGLAAPPGSSG